MLHPDGAAAVFKSQFMIAYFGMLLLNNVLSVVDLTFMTVGHTKFVPDGIAALIGKLFNESEVLNLGQLKEIVQQHASCWTYNTEGLRTIRRAINEAEVSQALLGYIQKSRSFRMIAADDECDKFLLEEEFLVQRDCVSGQEDWPAVETGAAADMGGSDTFISAERLDKACEELCKRDMSEKILDIFNKVVQGGLGCATGQYFDRQDGGLLRPPSDMTKLKKVLLYCRPSTTSTYWTRISGFHKRFASLSQDEITKYTEDVMETYNTCDDQRYTAMPLYGAGAKAVATVLGYVDPRYVDIHYDVEDLRHSTESGWEMISREHMKCEHLHQYTGSMLAVEMMRRGKAAGSMSRATMLEWVNADIESSQEEEPDWTNRPPTYITLAPGAAQVLRSILEDDITQAQAANQTVGVPTREKGYSKLKRAQQTCSTAGDTCLSVGGGDSSPHLFRCFYCIGSECATCAGLCSRQKKYGAATPFTCSSCRQKGEDEAIPLCGSTVSNQ